MALTVCRECNHQVSSEAKSCPGCGAPVAIERKRVSMLWALTRGALIVAGGFVVLILVAVTMAPTPKVGDVSIEDNGDPRYDAVPLLPDNRSALVANMSRSRVSNYVGSNRADLRSTFGTPYSTSALGDTEYWYYKEVSRDPVTGRRDRSVQFVIDAARGVVTQINY